MKKFENIDEALLWMLGQDDVSERVGLNANTLSQVKSRAKTGKVTADKKMELLKKYGFKIDILAQI